MEELLMGEETFNGGAQDFLVLFKINNEKINMKSFFY